MRGIRSQDGREGRKVATFDVGGVIGVSIHGASPRELGSVRRQLGARNGPLEDRPADIEIVYTDPPVGDLRLMGSRDAASDDHGLYLWGDSRDRAPVRMELGPELPFRLHVPRGATRLPLLVHLVSVAAARKGFIPLHASAFRWQEKGVLVAGWSKGGKTEALLGFMGRGGTYVGDEWLFMAPGEPVVSGIPEPIRVRDWHLGDLPELRERLSPRDRLKLAAVGATGTGLRRLASTAPSVHKVAELVERQRYVQIDPVRLFGPRNCTIRTGIDVVFLMVSATSPAVRAEAVDPATAAGRIAASTVHEHVRVLEAELKGRYARPDRGTPLWDTLDPAGTALAKQLSDLPTFEVLHPYPVSTPALFWVMAPLIEQS